MTDDSLTKAVRVLRAIPPAERARAVALGLARHGTFAIAIAAMIVALHEGLRIGQGRLVGGAAWAVNAALVLSFPAIHSFLQTRAPTHAVPDPCLYRFSRHPVYVAFTSTLWTAPVLTADRLLLGIVWTLHGLVGPLHEERRHLAREPERDRH